jgi:hypothetical protein
VLKLAGEAMVPVFATYLGGNGQDTASNVLVGAEDQAYLSGYTSSTDFPMSQAVQPQFGGGSSDAIPHPAAGNSTRKPVNIFVPRSGSFDNDSSVVNRHDVVHSKRAVWRRCHTAW